jgi:hypothetical protein
MQGSVRAQSISRRDRVFASKCQNRNGGASNRALFER